MHESLSAFRKKTLCSKIGSSKRPGALMNITVPSNISSMDKESEGHLIRTKEFERTI